MKRSQLVIETDVLVIGAGLAGCAAAIEAAEAGARVIMVGWRPGSSPRAQGGIAAAVGEDDSPALHAFDTIAAGGGLSAPAVVESVTGDGPATVAWLEEMGAHFDSGLGLEAAHSRSRVLHAGGDGSGRRLMVAIGRAVAHRPRITLIHGQLESLAGDSVCAGAWLRDGRLVSARCTVLATGGYAGAYSRTTNSRITDGAGIIAAERLGARLSDMEFVQFHPTVFAGPGPSFLLTEALRGAGATLVDAAGDRFVDELATRAEVSRALALMGAARLDARRVPRLEVRFPEFVRNCRRAGLNPLEQPVPVTPAAHYTMGGVVTDLAAWTGVPGLYAAGECAATGLHGANRLASNSLLEAAVMGRRAGVSAAAGAAGQCPPGARPALPAVGGNLTVGRVRELLWTSAGLFRRGDELADTLSLLDRETPSSPNAATIAAVARRVVLAALERRDSIGAHQRTDAAVAAA